MTCGRSGGNGGSCDEDEPSRQGGTCAKSIEAPANNTRANQLGAFGLISWLRANTLFVEHHTHTHTKLPRAPVVAFLIFAYVHP